MRKLSITNQKPTNQKPIKTPIISKIFNSVNSLFPGFNLPTNMFQQTFPNVNFLANFSGDISKLDVSNLGKLKFEQRQNYVINPNSEYIIGTNTYDPRLIPNVTPDTRFTNPDHTLTTQTFSINPNANGKYTLYKSDALKGYVPFYEFNIEQISKPTGLNLKTTNSDYGFNRPIINPLNKEGLISFEQMFNIVKGKEGANSARFKMIEDNFKIIFPTGNPKQITEAEFVKIANSSFTKDGMVNLNMLLDMIKKESNGLLKVNLINKELNKVFNNKLPQEINLNEFKAIESQAWIPLELNIVDQGNPEYGVKNIGDYKLPNHTIKYFLEMRKKFLKNPDMFPIPAEYQALMNNIDDPKLYSKGSMDNSIYSSSVIWHIKGYDEYYINSVKDVFPNLNLKNSVLVERGFSTIEDAKNYIRQQYKIQENPYDLNLLKLNGTDPKWNNKAEQIIEQNTIVVSNPSQFGMGSETHGMSRDALAHIYYLVTASNPKIAKLTQIQSDAFQSKFTIMGEEYLNSLEKSLYTNEEQFLKWNEAWLNAKQNPTDKTWTITLKNSDGNDVKHEGISNPDYQKSFRTSSDFHLWKAHIENFKQKQLLGKNHEERIIQELTKYFQGRGFTHIDIPTGQTTALIQNYHKHKPLAQIYKDTGSYTTAEINIEIKDVEIMIQTLEKYKKDWETAIKNDLPKPEKPSNLSIDLKNLKNVNRRISELKHQLKGGYKPDHASIMKKYDAFEGFIKKYLDSDVKIITDDFGVKWNRYTIKNDIEIIPFKYGGEASVSLLSNNQNKKYREGDTTTDPKESISNNYEVNFENYIKFLEDEEAAWSYVKNTNSAILKPDGTYYKIFENNKFYPYYYQNSTGTFEKDATIGYGSKGSNIYDDYKNGMSFEDAKKLQLIDIEKNFKITEQFINNKYGTDKNTNPFNYLTNHEKFMLTDYTYNVGSLSKFPKFTDAIINKDFKAALNEYKRFDEKGGKELGRNKGYLINYLTPWVNFQKERIKNEQEFIKRMEESLFNIPGFNEMDRGISGVNYIPH